MQIVRECLRAENSSGIIIERFHRSTMFNHLLGIGEGVANARIKGEERFYKKLGELNKNPEKHLIFSAVHDFISSNIDKNSRCREQQLCHYPALILFSNMKHHLCCHSPLDLNL